MGYAEALGKAWEDLLLLKPPSSLTVKFLADEYSLDLAAKRVLSLSCNAPVKDFLSILILHYSARNLRGLPVLSGQWVTFRQISGIQGYYPAYYSRTIAPVIRKYGRNPQAILGILDRLPASSVEGADVSVVIEAFNAVPLLIKLWKPDTEFGPEANLYFDASIKDIFCLEDIVVLAQLVVGQL